VSDCETKASTLEEGAAQRAAGDDRRHADPGEPMVSPPAEARTSVRVDRVIDQGLASFPASDPPSWWAGR
jgi:hypothetical protein